MKTIILHPFFKSILFFMCLGNFAFAQCPAGNVALPDQQAVNDFVAAYPSCSNLTGSLFIGNPLVLPSDINDISGLSSITTVADQVWISYNPDLLSLNGLQNITSIGGRLYVQRNSSLTNLEGLNALQSIGGDLGISAQDISSFQGLNSLTSVGQHFTIYDSNNITSFNGLSNLSTIGGNFDVTFNNNLNSFNGLENLQSINGYLRINNNMNLSDIQGIQQIDAEGINGSSTYDIEIMNNPLLSNCAIESLCGALALPGVTAHIQNNGVGCDSETEMQTACDELNSIEVENRLVFQMYPNPADDILHFKTDGIYRVNIYDGAGREIKSIFTAENGGLLPVEDLLPGIYIIRAEKDGIQISEKLIVK